MKIIWHKMRHPDGRKAIVNEEGVMSLARQGYHVPLTAPDGTEGYVPLDRVDEAIKAGFRFGHGVHNEQ